MNNAENIPDKANIENSCEEVMETRQISDDESNMNLLSEGKALKWVNTKLNRTYDSVAQLKGGPPPLKSYFPHLNTNNRKKLAKSTSRI